MVIDGIGGPKGPAGPSGPGAIQPSEQALRGEGIEPSFQVEVAETAPGPEGTAGRESINLALREVAACLHTGEIPTIQAAVEVFLRRVVESRYQGMNPAEQARFSTYLKEIAAIDPVMSDRIQAMLNNALGGRREI